MKKSSRVVSIMLLMVFSSSFILGCANNDVSEPDNALKTIEIKGQDSVIIGKTVQLSTILTPESVSSDLVFTWTSANVAVATVDDEGLVKGISEGNTTITVKCGEISDDFSLSVVYDTDNRTNLYVQDPDNVKITQFADLHFGDPTKNYHNGKVEETIAYMDYVVSQEKPDIIVCSGDNILSTGTSGLSSFITLMEKYKTPWTYIYGNHDGESATGSSSKKTLHEYLLKAMSSTDYLIYKDGFVDTTSNRYGNFSIKVYDQSTKIAKLGGSIILMDSGLYDYNLGGYESITKTQIDWYSSEIKLLDDEFNNTKVIPSILFQHIQLPEFYQAYKDAKANTNNVKFVVSQDLTSSEIEEIKGGGPASDPGFFNKIKELGSTKAVFVGHAHNFLFQVNLDGIVLGFAPQAGHANIFPKDDDPRNTYTYIVDKDFGFSTSNTKEPYIKLGATSATIMTTDYYELSYELKNIDGDIKITENDSSIASYKIENGVITITPKKNGKYMLTFAIDNGYKLEKTFTLNIRAVSNYNLFNSTGENKGTYTGLYAAIDQLFVDGLESGSYINKVDSNDSSFEYDSNLPYNYLTKDGQYYGFDDNENVENGKAKWWSTNINDLSLYTQNSASLLNTSITSAQFGWIARQADFTSTNTDGNGGYQAGQGSPDSTWSGWQASVYKPGISVAEYVGWADNNAGTEYPNQYRNNFKFEYDLSNSTMKPSNNANQPTIADIWVGSSYANIKSGDDKIPSYLTGVTFNAGTSEANKDLANGTSRNMYLFYEELPIASGLTSNVSNDRTYGDAVGTATWNKEKGVWEFNDVLKLNMNIVTDGTSNFTLLTSATYGSKETSFTKEFSSVLDASTFRLIYGINYTPDIKTNSRKVNDITNGGNWKNVVQKNASAYLDSTYLRDLGFLKGRVINGARQIGIYGSDVCSVSKNASDEPIFNFIY